MTTSDNAISSQSRAGPGSLVFVYNKAVQHMSSDRWLVIITNRASQLKHLFPHCLLTSTETENISGTLICTANRNKVS